MDTVEVSRRFNAAETFSSLIEPATTSARITTRQTEPSRVEIDMTAPDKTETASSTENIQRTFSSVSRRNVLSVGAVGAAGMLGTMALAGCSKAKSPDSPTVGSASGSTTAGTPSSANTSTSGGTPSSSSADNADALAKVADIPVGQSISAQDASGQPILISRPTDSTVVAFSAICPHQGCTVAKTFHCPCHGSVFDPKTGDHLAGPAPTGLKAMSVKISGADIVAG
jgi:Rieske Fe-S protein